NRSAFEIFSSLGDRSADANAGAQKLVGGLKPGRGVDGIAIGGVIEEAAATEIADQRWACMNADAGCTETHAFFLPALAKRLRPDVEILRAGDRPRRIIRLLAGRVEQHLDRIADNLRD